MAKPDTIVIDGHGYSWQRISELRRQQLEAWKAEQARQLALFELKDDCRPEAERTAAGRFLEPTLFADMTTRREIAPVHSPDLPPGLRQSVKHALPLF
jgi:hypothetical protein